MNLPNAITVGRILVAPLIAALPFMSSAVVRLAAFVIYIVAAVSDYYDGMLARTRGLVTDLGSLLDPLADKLLLFATLIPMFILMSPPTDPFAPDRELLGAAHQFPFTPVGRRTTARWIVVIVIGRELSDGIPVRSRKKGVVIGAIGPAKWKTGFSARGSGLRTSGFAQARTASSHGWDFPRGAVLRLVQRDSLALWDDDRRLFLRSIRLACTLCATAHCEPVDDVRSKS